MDHTRFLRGLARDLLRLAELAGGRRRSGRPPLGYADLAALLVDGRHAAASADGAAPGTAEPVGAGGEPDDGSGLPRVLGVIEV